MRVFLLIWFGQLISMVGSGLTRFGLGVWVYQQTGSVSQFALISVFATLPTALISPFAGALVDRWNLGWTMVLGNFAASFSSLGIAFLLLTHQLALWHIYLATGLNAVFITFQVPAFSVLTTLLVPKNYLNRASGMGQLAYAFGQLFAPILAGFLIVSIKLQGVIFIDYITFLIAMLTLWIVRSAVFNLKRNEKNSGKSLLQEVIEGWQYIAVRRGLLALLLFLTAINLVIGPFYILITPLILSFASPSTLGIILSLSGLGMILGGLTVSIWKGPQYSIKGVLGFAFLGSLCVAIMGLSPSIPLISFAIFLGYYCIPFFTAYSRVIFQKKSPIHLQGRVIACYQTFLTLSFPLAYGFSAILADFFEGLLAVNGPFAANIGLILGVGPGRGIGFLFVILGTLAMLIVLTAYCYRPLRLVEVELPDAISNV